MAKKDKLEAIKAAYKEDAEWWKDNHALWLADAKFRVIGHGNQWDPEIKKWREANGLPCLEVDKLNQYVMQVVNDGRQNRPAVKVRPVDDRGDPEVAEALQGLIRHICDRSNADEAFDTALDHAVACGFGFLRVVTEYAHEKTFNHELVVRRVPNPLACLLGRHVLADGSDARRGFFIEDIQKDEYRRRYPKAKNVDFNDDAFKKDGWSDEKTVRVCEFWEKVEEEKDHLMLVDGTVVTADEYKALLDADGQPPEVIDARPLPTTRIDWYCLSGAEILEEREWLGKYIPIIPVYGNEQNIEGKITYSGLIRAAKDPQRLYNFSRSAFAQRVAMTPKAPWLIAEGQLEGHEDEWKNANTGTVAALTYKETSVDGHPVPPPQRVNPSDIPGGFAEDMSLSEHDIRSSMGMHKASLGEESNEKSGKAILARQREGDVATFHYQDNLSRAIRYLGRILVDAAPKYYDSRRVVRILGEDGASTMAQIDPQQPQAVVKQGSKAIYNLGVGTYDVSVAAGPSYTTKRQESAEAMLQLTQANPTMWQTHGDLIVQSQDWPNADEFAKRSKLTLPDPIRQIVEAEEADGSEDPELVQARIQMDQLRRDAEQAIAERDQALQQATQALEAEKANKEAALMKARADLLNAETDRMRAEAEASAPGEAPVDNSVELAKLGLERERVALERERLAKEDEWKQLDAATKVIVASIPSGQPSQPGAEPGEGGELPDDDMDETAPIEPNLALTTALGEFKQALEGMNGLVAQMQRPRKVLRDLNGLISGVE
jgi:hypothetical protein